MVVEIAEVVSSTILVVLAAAMVVCWISTIIHQPHVCTNSNQLVSNMALSFFFFFDHYICYLCQRKYGSLPTALILIELLLMAPAVTSYIDSAITDISS